MNNFLILFNEKEGSSAIIDTLNNYDKINIVGFEPFDKYHFKKPMPPNLMKKYFNIIYSRNQNKYHILFKEYKTFSDRPLKIKALNVNESYGMKFRPRNLNLLAPILKQNNVIVFMLFRNNILRWALSKYTKKHLQFKKKDDPNFKLQKIHYDINKLTQIVNKCKQIIKRKRKIVQNLRKKGVNVKIITYEQFQNKKLQFFKRFFQIINYKISDETIRNTMHQTAFKKVHSDNIKEFAINANEILKKFT